MNIKIDLKIFLLALLFCITKQIKIYAILMIFVILHELGHLVAGILFKYKPMAIRITPFGLQIEFEVKCEEYNQKVLKGNSICIKRALIAIAGPMTNALFVFIFWICPNIYDLPKEMLIYSNVLIGTFNLLPIYPLDGGRVLKEILHILFGFKKSYEYINIITNISIILLTVISSILILYLKNISILLINIYLWILVIKENKKYKMIKRVSKILDKKYI